MPSSGRAIEALEGMHGAVVIRCYPRIHINSLDLSGKGPRTSGGLGFLIDACPSTISVKRANIPSITVAGYARERIEYILAELARHYGIPERGWEVACQRTLKPHVGLGSTTQLEAAVVSAIYLSVYGKTPPMKAYLDAGIGRCSAVGLNLFLNGGFVVDFGYRSGSSSAAMRAMLEGSQEACPSAWRASVPESWRVLVAIHREITGPDGDEESSFWKRVLPTPVSHATRICHSTLLGVMPALLEQDLPALRHALAIVCRHGSKPYEYALHRKALAALVRRITRDFQFCGMSSLGPSLYAISDAEISRNTIEEFRKRFPNFDFHVSGVRNEGAEIISSPR